MVNLDWKPRMISSETSIKSPRSNKQLQISIPTIPTVLRVSDLSPASDSSCYAYEQYVRLPELRQLWSIKEFPGWKDECILKPALQGLETTFRFVSTVLLDPRPYANRREWKRRLESLAADQVEIIAMLCEGGQEDGDTPPIIDLTSSSGTLARENSSEVWKISGDTTVVSKTSVSSLLPRLATWHKSEDIAEKISYSIECEMRRCRYTLGLGEPNLAGKPSLNYDEICKPAKLHRLMKNSPSDQMNLENMENQNLYTIHQVLETWIFVSQELLKKILNQIEEKDFEKGSSNCWLLENIWKLLNQIEKLHLLMDPDDFLRLKNQLSIKLESESESFCFRSHRLVEITKLSKDLRHKVPYILDVEVDPKGGPRIQEAAMELYRKKKNSEKIHLLQARQALEITVKEFYYSYKQKEFYYSYKQLLVVMMGSVEARANRGFVRMDTCDALAQIFMEPTYFPSLDAANTFLGDYWSHGRAGSELRK